MDFFFKLSDRISFFSNWIGMLLWSSLALKKEPRSRTKEVNIASLRGFAALPHSCLEFLELFLRPSKSPLLQVIPCLTTRVEQPLPSAQLHSGRDPHKNNYPWGRLPVSLKSRKKP